jgi:hypothetical protein
MMPPCVWRDLCSAEQTPAQQLSSRQLVLRNLAKMVRCTPAGGFVVVEYITQGRGTSQMSIEGGSLRVDVAFD